MGKPNGEDAVDRGAILVLARDALGILQKDLAALLGVSPKTIGRWTSGSTLLPPDLVATLARAVGAKDPALAAKIAAAHGHTLSELGIAQSASPSLSSSAGPSREQQILADALVCAAAEVADVSPRRMRPALAAALARAREAGLTIDAAHALLSAPEPATKETKTS